MLTNDTTEPTFFASSPFSHLSSPSEVDTDTFSDFGSERIDKTSPTAGLALNLDGLATTRDSSPNPNASLALATDLDTSLAQMQNPNETMRELNESNILLAAGIRVSALNASLRRAKEAMRSGRTNVCTTNLTLKHLNERAADQVLRAHEARAGLECVRGAAGAQQLVWFKGEITAMVATEEGKLADLEREMEACVSARDTSLERIARITQILRDCAARLDEVVPTSRRM
ncbi:hypothetical protein BKA62DRAFT_822681 [Auriculariales sp. MPI-PUGE-AT-0066]|nr:hypothetical protein BKA62DRAFT_822681 [Auriculariales sp. MPI-PUGE-AT-0066]